MQIKAKNLLVIPTYNCENQIARVLAKIKIANFYQFQEILIIDNRSTDHTKERAKEFILKNSMPVKILINDKNNNLGGTLKNAFNYAIRENYTYIGVIHGDDQGNPADLKEFLVDNIKLNFDLAIGSRFNRKSNLIGYSIVRNLGNRFVNVLASIIMKNNIEDLIAGVNIYRVDFLRRIPFESFPNNLTFDAHLLFSSIIHKGEIRYFPITWKDEDQISNARIFRQGFLILKTLLNSRRKNSVLRQIMNDKNISPRWSRFL